MTYEAKKFEPDIVPPDPFAVELLFTEEGKEYLGKWYGKMEFSASELARHLGTYPNRILKALKHHGFEVRDRSEARKVSLKTGRVEPPMLGKHHSPQTKDRIRNRMLGRKTKSAAAPAEAVPAQEVNNAPPQD